MIHTLSVLRACRRVGDRGAYRQLVARCFMVCCDAVRGWLDDKMCAGVRGMQVVCNALGVDPLGMDKWLFAFLFEHLIILFILVMPPKKPRKENQKT